MKTRLVPYLFENKFPPEAGKNDIFGQYLFAPSRPYDTPDPKEQNTEEENKFIRALGDWFINSDEFRLKKFAKKVMDLLAKNKYERYLSAGDRKAYRGMKITKKDLLKLISPYGEKIQYNKAVTMSYPDVLKPQAGKLLQSWSVDISQGIKFASYKRGGDWNVSIVFVARTDAEGNNFFGYPEGLAQIVTGEPEYEKEAEVISVGNIEYDGFVYYVSSKSDEDDYSISDNIPERDFYAAVTKVA